MTQEDSQHFAQKIRQEDTADTQSPRVLPSQNQNPPGKLKSLFSKVAKPKYIVLFLAIILILGSLVALSMLSGKSGQNTSTNPEIVIASPTTENSPKPKNPEIQAELDKYNQKVDALKSKSIDFSPPQLDLEITF